MNIFRKRWDDEHWNAPPCADFAPGVFDRERWDREAPGAAAVVDADLATAGDVLARLLFPENS